MSSPLFDPQPLETEWSGCDLHVAADRRRGGIEQR